MPDLYLRVEMIPGWSRSKSLQLKLPSTQHPCTSVKSSLWPEGKTSRCTSLTTRLAKKLVGLGSVWGLVLVWFDSEFFFYSHKN